MRMAINQVTNQPNVLVEVPRAFFKRCLAERDEQFVGICHKWLPGRVTPQKYQLCVEILDGGTPW